jgi:4-amino-4-deoxy-L-arabinose transferase-like glycosyltransferase
MSRRAQGTLAALAAVLTVMVLGLWVDAHLAHGLSAEWRHARDGTTEVVAQTTEHRVWFPNAHRPLARYVQHWDFERWGVPDHLPLLDARLHGTLQVPEGPARQLRATSPNRARIFVDRNEADQATRLPPGHYPVEVRWRGRFAPRASLRLEWAAGTHFEPIPQRAWTPTTGPWTPWRTRLWIFVPLLAIGLGWLAWRAGSATGRAQAHRRWAALAIVATMLLSLGYRSFDYEVMPEFTENLDELFAAWNGWSLLTEGETRGWSMWPERYGHLVEIEHLPYFRARPIRVIQPYFEHPPLLHLLAGGAAKLGGAAHWAHARLMHTRTVPIALGVLTTLLLIALARRLDAKGPGPYFAGLLYAVLPIIALQGRVVKEEALVAPMALGSLLFYLRWRDGGERHRDLVIAAVLAGLITLAKVPGILFLGALVLLLMHQRRYGPALTAAGCGAAGASLLAVYAAAIDWNVFWHATFDQASVRPAHWNLYARFFDDALINHNLVGRPWLLFLWLAFALALPSFTRRDRPVLVLPTLVYLLGIGLSSGNWTFGWYLMPIYPLLCIGAGRFLADLWERPDLLRGTLFIVLAVMYGMNFTQPPEAWIAREAWSDTRRVVTLFLALAITPYVLAQVSRARPVRILARTVTAAGLAMLVGLSAYFVVSYDRLYESHRNFDRVEFFDR